MIVNLVAIILLQCGIVITQDTLKSSTVNSILQQLKDSLDHYNTSKLAVSICSNCSLSWEKRIEGNAVLADHFGLFLNEIQNVTKDGAPLKPIFSNFTSVTKTQSTWPSLTLNVWGNAPVPADKLTHESADMVLEAFVDVLLSTAGNNSDRHTMGSYYTGSAQYGRLCLCQADYVVQAVTNSLSTSRYQLLKSIDNYFGSSTVKDYYISSELSSEGNTTSVKMHFIRGLNESNMSMFGTSALSFLRASTYSIQVTPLKNVSSETAITFTLLNTSSTTTYATKPSTSTSTLTPVSTSIPNVKSSTSTSTKTTTSTSPTQTTSPVINTSLKPSTGGTSVISTTSAYIATTSLANRTSTASYSSPKSSSNAATSTYLPSTRSTSFSTTSKTGSYNKTTFSVTPVYTKVSTVEAMGTTLVHTNVSRINSTRGAALFNDTGLLNGSSTAVSSQSATDTTIPLKTDVATEAGVKVVNKIEEMDLAKFNVLYVTIPSFAGILFLVLGCWFCFYYAP